MTEPFTYTQVQDYMFKFVPERPAEVQRMEAFAQENDYPFIGPVVGQLCYLLAKLVGAKRVFELGSGFGYSTAWFARAVQENTQGDGSGVVYHVVWDEKLSQIARHHLSALGYDGLIEYRMAEAVEALQKTDGPFDLIFNDIDKADYPASLAVIAEKLRPGGLLIVDNMFLGGNTFDANNKSAEAAAEVAGVHEFTRLITTSPDWIVSFAPIWDGLIIAQKR